MGHLMRSAGGHLLRRGGHLFSDGNGSDCCCGGVPCECPGGLATTYTVTGWSGTVALPADGSCDFAQNNCTDVPVPNFDGTLTDPGAGDCVWQAGPVCINGFTGGAVIALEVGAAPTCFWLMTFTCGNAASLGNQCDIWYGIKTTGTTPAGTYTRTDGTDPHWPFVSPSTLPATMTVT